MPLIHTKNLFAKALKGNYTLGAFNVNNVELLRPPVNDRDRIELCNDCTHAGCGSGLINCPARTCPPDNRFCKHGTSSEKNGSYSNGLLYTQWDQAVDFAMRIGVGSTADESGSPRASKVQAHQNAKRRAPNNGCDLGECHPGIAETETHLGDGDSAGQTRTHEENRRQQTGRRHLSKRQSTRMKESEPKDLQLCADSDFKKWLLLSIAPVIAFLAIGMVLVAIVIPESFKDYSLVVAPIISGVLLGLVAFLSRTTRRNI